MKIDFFKTVINNADLGLKQYVVTVVNSAGSSPASVGQKMIVTTDGSQSGTIGGGNLEFLVSKDILNGRFSKPEMLTYSFNDDEIHDDKDQTGMICGGSATIFVEPLFSVHELFIFGAGHCSLELTAVLENLGFYITVLDERVEWLNKHTKADKHIVTDADDVVKFVTNPLNSYIVIMTHGHQNDEKILKQFLNKKYKYVGMMGSTAKVSALRKNLTDSGISLESLNHLHAPIGVAIGSKSPKEIAISIAAELISTKNEISK